jgi:hypothetical protein
LGRKSFAPNVWPALLILPDLELRGPGRAVATAKSSAGSQRPETELADDDGPIFSTVAKLVDALQRAIPQSRNLFYPFLSLINAGKEKLRGSVAILRVKALHRA